MSGLNLRPRQRRMPDVNITSLIDVVLLLLLFFMLSTTFDHNAELRIELPKTDAEASRRQAPEAIEISIDREGRYYVDQREVVNTSVDTLRLALRKALGERQTSPVLINADARAPYQTLITAMDAASQAGLYQITFVANPSEAGPETPDSSRAP